MDEWKVGDPADWGDSVGVPDIPYMGYLDDDDEGDGYCPPSTPQKSRAQTLLEEAWSLRNQGRYHDALDAINEALRQGKPTNEFYNIKAIILEDMGEYGDALRNYNRSLDMGGSQTVKNNKARLLQNIAYKEQAYNDLEKALRHINEALTISDDENDRKEFLRTKGYLLFELGRKVDSKICHYLADGKYEKVELTEKRARILNESSDTFICIAGTRFYDRERLLTAGTRVELVREPDNVYDPDAIRIEIRGETVGYVANSNSTLISEVKSASEIKDIIKDDQKATIMFKFLDEYIVARLI